MDTGDESVGDISDTIVNLDGTVEGVLVGVVTDGLVAGGIHRQEVRNLWQQSGTTVQKLPSSARCCRR